MADLRQSTSQVIRFGPFLDSTDGITPETALTIAQADMQISKDGGAFAQKNTTGNATHDVDGWYSTTLDATDTNTATILEFQVTVSGALPYFKTYNVLTTTAYDAIYTGTFNNLGGTAQTGDSFARLGAPAGASVSADIADVPTVSEFNARTLASADYFDPATDTVANVTTVATTTTNTDMRGTDSAFLASSAPTNFSALGISVGGAIDNVTLVTTTTTNTDMRGTDSAATAAALATVDANVDAILIDTGTTLPAQITALNDISTADILASGDVDGYSIEETLKLLGTASYGTLSGAATTTVTITAPDASKARLTATVDAAGNRSAVVKDATG